VRYTSPDEDSGRWDGFEFRPGDIVISTRSKSGTTWMQMICALLIFQTSDLPESLTTLSPWLDMLTTPTAEIFDRLDAQQHRRFIKTHTPLDGIPLDDRATYIVVAREPIDMAVSLYHQGANINRTRLRELTGQPEPTGTEKPPRPLHQWLVDWIDRDSSPREQTDSLPGVMWHLADAWRRRDQPNIVLVHYDDLLADTGGEMRRLARRLAIDVAEPLWPTLVDAAGFASMRANAEAAAPNPLDVLKDNAAFFRRGSSGAGREILTEAELAHYRDRLSDLAPLPLLDWLER
jgi:aryl sulfotransferase